MNNPVWIDDKGKIIEPEYCRDFLSRHPMRCINDRFYTVEGPLPDESKLKRTIYEELSPWIHAKVAQTVEQVIKALKLAAYTDPLPLQCDRIHVANGTCFLDGTFTEEKEYCGNRLLVSYRADAPEPEHWLRFLSELLEPEDIPALQEYLGYCLIPSTKGQKMLMLIGKGGEGKSRIGVVMSAIFGLNMNTTSIQKVENSRFARADLEGKLLMVDDDLDMNALTKTNYVKSIVTAELRMDLERKKEQSYQGLLYVRFLCFGNGALTALHDRSDGFFRRQIILTTKDKPADRFDDPFLAEKLIAEKEGIFLWMLEGLRRLIANRYHFTISQRARDNITSAVRDANNILDFLDSEGYGTLIDGGNCMRKHKDFMSEPDYGYIDIESCFEPIFEPPLETLEEWRSLEDEPEPTLENTSVYVTEPDGIQYFYCGNTRIRVSEHFSQAGKPMDKLIENVVQYAARNAG